MQYVEHGQTALEQSVFARLDAAEVRIVARVAASARAVRVQWLAYALTRAGNGALYPVLTLVLIASGRVASPSRFVAAVCINLLIAFSVYPMCKRVLARTRPCDYDVALMRFSAPLDRYSCPSGHTMTVVAFSITVMFAWPDGASFAIPLCAAMGWSRVALGHHYPTDVLAGGALGAVVATPVSALFY